MCPRYLLGHPVEPHRAMRSMMFNLVGEADFRGSAYCCECNLCSMWSCPENLDPKNICSMQKKRLAAEGKKWADVPFDTNRAALHMRDRKAPTHRLLTRLGLTRFTNVGPLSEKVLAATKVGIALKQHVGAPCEAVVKAGQKVAVGDVVGRPGMQNGKPALGAPVHASIAGTVLAVADGVVWIQK
jgi:Na+-translocating ferredoxin:NAD+ oxidoreductase RnfC subunit